MEPQKMVMVAKLDMQAWVQMRVKVVQIQQVELAETQIVRMTMHLPELLAVVEMQMVAVVVAAPGITAVVLVLLEAAAAAELVILIPL